MALNITTAVIGSGCNAATASPSLAQWDKGQILQISGVELPETYKVEFSNGDTLEAIPAIGTAEGVEIPDKLLYSSSPIRTYIVLSEAEGERNTEYWVTIYVKPREIPEGIEPDPDQQDVIDDLIAQLNTGVGKAGDAADAAEASAQDAEAASQAVQDLGVRAETAASGAPAAVQKIVDAETGAVTLVFFLPQGAAGVSPVVTVTTITSGHRVTVTDAAGAHTFDVMDGEDGRSVTDVTMGADYKLTFTFSDGTTWTSESIRGETGVTPRLTIGTVQTLEPGQDAIAEITGTPEDPVLNLGIPKGETGASDAGVVTYNPETAYNDGTVGKAVSDLSRQLSDLEDTISTTQIINSASGDIASFDDGADGMPVKSLIANIEPVQDLHGYDNPWPAGGGVNLVSLALSPAQAERNLNVNISNRSDKSITLTTRNEGSYSGLGLFYNLKAGTYSIRFKYESENSGVGGVSTVYNVTAGGIVSSAVNGFPANSIRTFTLSEDSQIEIRMFITKEAATNTATISELQLSEGSTLGDWTPYSNICPISGHTGAEIEQTGKNLFDKANYENTVTRNGVTFTNNGDGSITANGTATGGAAAFALYNTLKIRNTLSILQGRACTLTGCPEGGSQASYYINAFRMTNLGTGSAFDSGNGRDFILSIGEGNPNISIVVKEGTTVNNLVFRPQLVLGSTAFPYEPYTGNQISVNWEDEAGTVYGGTLTINPDRTGQLVVTHGIVTENNFTTVPSGLSSGGLHWTDYELTNITTAGNSICSILGQRKDGNPGWASSVPCYAFTDRTRIRVYCTESTIAEFKERYAGLQIIYPLATTIEYPLTESEISGILTTLYGTNNIWSSTGDTEVTYPADTKLYIDGKIAEAIAALNS